MAEVKVTTKDTLREYWKHARNHKFAIFVMLFALGISSVLDTIVPVYIKNFFDLLSISLSAVEKAVPALLGILIFTVVLRFISWIGYRVSLSVNNWFAARVLADIRERSFDYMIKHAYGFFANNFGGALVQRVNRLARSYETFMDRIYWDLFPLVIRVIVTIGALWLLNHVIAFVMFGWVILFLLFNYVFARWRMKYNTIRAERETKMTAVLADAITNHTNIQLFTGNDSEHERYRGAVENWRKILRFTWDMESVVFAVQGLLILGVEFFLNYYILTRWNSNPFFTVGTLVLVQGYIMLLMNKMHDFGRVIRMLYESFADAKEMVTILKTPYEIKDARNAKPLVVKHGAIEFKNVTFSFHKTRKVLDHINLSVRPGEKIAFIGPSGAGKSTMIKLLFRLYDVSDGKIFIDKQMIDQVTQESLRSALSLVPQDPVLFHRTLMENIRYGKRDATDEEVVTSAKLAHCHEFIEDLPQKYDTFVGERGIKLSGGERQRVAIARAFLKNAPILVLDEATSSLDSYSESLIQDALHKLMEKKTVIVIAHRLSTIRQMDRIVVMEGGKIIDQGTHDTLLAKNGLYSQLWQLQAGGFITELEEEI